MNRIAITLSLAAAFAAGCSVTHLLRPAIAAENITAQVIHTGELEGDALGPANAGGMRSKMFVSADGMTISIQDGNVPKHMHPNTNEIQYILEGTGTIWLGDKEVQGEAGRSRRDPEGHAAWRHQARRPHLQGDRDQDAAAGAGRYEDAELRARFAPSLRSAAKMRIRTFAMPGSSLRDASAMTAVYPRPSAASAARPAAAARPASPPCRSG